MLTVIRIVPMAVLPHHRQACRPGSSSGRRKSPSRRRRTTGEPHPEGQRRLSHHGRAGHGPNANGATTAACSWAPGRGPAPCAAVKRADAAGGRPGGGTGARGRRALALRLAPPHHHETAQRGSPPVPAAALLGPGPWPCRRASRRECGPRGRSKPAPIRVSN